MKLVLFKNLQDKYSSLQYGIVGDNENLGIKKLAMAKRSHMEITRFSGQFPKVNC